ncbi:unnamed protein product [Phaeothamnion confervicola]
MQGTSVPACALRSSRSASARTVMSTEAAPAAPVPIVRKRAKNREMDLEFLQETPGGWIGLLNVKNFQALSHHRIVCNRDMVESLYKRAGVETVDIERFFKVHNGKEALLLPPALWPCGTAAACFKCTSKAFSETSSLIFFSSFCVCCLSVRYPDVGRCNDNGDGKNPMAGGKINRRWREKTNTAAASNTNLLPSACNARREQYVIKYMLDKGMKLDNTEGMIDGGVFPVNYFTVGQLSYFHDDVEENLVKIIADAPDL